MNPSSVYINEAMEYAFSIYVKTKDHKGTLEYNSFMCTIVRLLLIIFGEEVVLDYQTKNPATLIFTMTKFGLRSLTRISIFFLRWLTVMV